MPAVRIGSRWRRTNVARHRDSVGAQLLFVYNGDAGFLARSLDYIHKVASPQTYACRLCALTYGPLGLRADWKNFLASLPLAVRFLHRDQFRRQHVGSSATPLPAVFLAGLGSEPQQLVAAEQLQQIDSLAELQAMIVDVSEQAARLATPAAP
jgi:hypothetical protein